jgi:hypothetical protein
MVTCHWCIGQTRHLSSDPILSIPVNSLAYFVLAMHKFRTALLHWHAIYGLTIRQIWTASWYKSILKPQKVVQVPLFTKINRKIGSTWFLRMMYDYLLEHKFDKTKSCSVRPNFDWQAGYSKKWHTYTFWIKSVKNDL